jgi:hypothetical protein
MPLFAAAAFALVCLGACGSGNGDAPSNAVAPEASSGSAARVDAQTGSISFALQTAGVRFDAFDYVITGPHFQTHGTLDVSNSTTVSGVVGGIPIGTGYAVTLSGSSVDTPRAQCQGSKSFDITTDAVTPVPVTINCREGKAMLTPPPTETPLPPFAPVLLGTILLALGARRRTS